MTKYENNWETLSWPEINVFETPYLRLIGNKKFRNTLCEYSQNERITFGTPYVNLVKKLNIFGTTLGGMAKNEFARKYFGMPDNTKQK